MVWSLFDEKKGELKPRVFSNGKTQEDVVNEVLSEIKKGTKIIFIHGVCGSGKSAIALNIAKELGKASIVVPIKNLQRQYESDYSHKKYVLKKNGKKLDISILTGRRNHICPYLAENKKEVLATRIKEKNSNLYEIFNKPSEDPSKLERDSSCDNPILPCKIEIKTKNLQTLRKYYTENPERKDNSELNLKVAKRLAIAPACPYWSPILSSNMKINQDWNKKEYASVGGGHTFYLRKPGCPYYSQFMSYLNSDVIIFNSDQYILETLLGRKPSTEVEIIDECDEFLDSFALEGSINLTRLRNELNSIICSEQSSKELVDSLAEEVDSIFLESKRHINEKDNILELKKTKAAELVKTLVKSDTWEIVGEDSYLEHCLEESKKFYSLMDEVYVNFYKDPKKGDIFIKLITINLDSLLKSLIDKNKAFVFMSGTLHSERVLKEIFGLTNFKIIGAEIFNQGTIKRLKSGIEQNFKFQNFSNGRFGRKEYLQALDRCIQIAKIPIVVHVNSFQDLPNENEIEEYGLKNLIASSKLMEMQNEDREGRIVRDFKEGKTSILFTTRCSRGIDFPFETCNSVVITKFPYPNTQSLFWRILKQDKPDIFWDFYNDKAHRELLQRVYRSVRDPRDSVFLLSPDIRVLNSKIV